MLILNKTNLCKNRSLRKRILFIIFKSENDAFNMKANPIAGPGFLINYVDESKL